MGTPVKVNISRIIDNSRLGSFQWGIFLLCGLCLIMDGFDTQAIGYVAPALARDWHITNKDLGPVLSAALVGVLVGSLLCGMLADKIGRRPVLIGSTLAFSALTFFAAQSDGIQNLILIRFLGGIGLGAIMPNAMALCGEYSPAKYRVPVMMVVSNGFTSGAAIGGFIAAGMIPNYGWRSVFYFGAAIPLIIGIVMIFALPESLQFLALRGNANHKIARWLKRISPDAPVGVQTEYAIPEERKRGVPMIQLFHEGRATGTVLLWIINFMNLLNLYFLSSWLPKVVSDAGVADNLAVLAGTMLQVGGLIGSFVLGWYVHKLGFVPVLGTCFLLGCLSIAAIGRPGLAVALLFVAIFIAGFCVPGGQAGINALAATYYPTDLRSTGIGSGLGIGRIGAIVGPLVAGNLLGRHMPTSQLFIAASIPALISALAVFSLRWVIKPTQHTVTDAEVLVH